MISHDDRFFHVADLLVTLDDGRLREVPGPAAARDRAEEHVLAVDVQGSA